MSSQATSTVRTQNQTGHVPSSGAHISEPWGLPIITTEKKSQPLGWLGIETSKEAAENSDSPGRDVGSMPAVKVKER